MKRLFEITGAALLLAASLCICPAARAQDGNVQRVEEPDKPVEAKGVGIAGGAIAGAEVVVVAEAIIGVDKTWAYLTFPWLGAVGGGIGGYFVERESTGGAVALLIGSMALVIPTALIASAATAYDPGEDGEIQETGVEVKRFSFEEVPSVEAEAEGTTTEVEERPQGERPEDRSGPNSETNRESRNTPRELRDGARRPEPGYLLNVDKNGRFGFAVPAVGVRPVSLPVSDATGGKTKGVEVLVPLVRVDLP